MPKQFTVSMRNGLGEEIQSEDIRVEPDIPNGWKLVHQQDGVHHQLQSDVPYNIPLSKSVPNEGQLEATFIIGVSPTYPGPEPPNGEMELQFFYDERPLREITLYLPPGRSPESTEE